LLVLLQCALKYENGGVLMSFLTCHMTQSELFELPTAND